MEFQVTESNEADQNTNSGSSSFRAEATFVREPTTSSVYQRAEADAPSETDHLGFAPYVSAVAGFLISRETATPITMSVEAEWGAGKSSFMLQLRRAIENAAGPKNYTIDFNAWRYEKDEALWAAFALNFLKKLRPQLNRGRVLRGNASLQWQRLDWSQGRFRILRTAAMSLGLAAATSIGVIKLLHPGWPSSDGWLTNLIAGITALCTIASTAYATVGNPFEHDLKKYFDTPDYRGKRTFVESFEEDFRRIVKSYLKHNERIFVFIDDLDRCDVPRAADLLKALNLLMSGDDLPIVYVIGLDRIVVSAAVAASLTKQSPFLFPSETDAVEKNVASLDFALDYIEKFVQIPFRLPKPDAAAVARYVGAITGLGNIPKGTEAVATPADAVLVTLKADSPDLVPLIECVAPLFGNNPRRLKQFVNLFRLQALIAYQTGQFEAQVSREETLTLPKLAKIVAILQRYPRLAALLRIRPYVLLSLQHQAKRVEMVSGPEGEEDYTRPAYDGSDQDVKWFSQKNELMDLLEYRSEEADWDIGLVDIARLLSTLPARTRAAPEPQNSEPSGRLTLPRETTMYDISGAG